MDPLEHVIRTTVAENFFYRAQAVYKNNPEMERDIDSIIKEALLRGYQKIIDRSLDTQTLLDEEKEKIRQVKISEKRERLRQINLGKNYIADHFIRIMEKWTESQKLQEKYTNMLMSIGSLRDKTSELLKTLNLLKETLTEPEKRKNDSRIAEEEKSLGKINLAEPKFTLYVFDLVGYLQREDNIINTLKKQGKQPTDEDIRAAVTKEHQNPEDYLKHFRDSFNASVNYKQLLTNFQIALTNRQDQGFMVDFHVPIREIIEENFIKADIEWLYPTNKLIS